MRQSEKHNNKSSSQSYKAKKHILMSWKQKLSDTKPKLKI
jgi:hypothetical protein